MVAAPLFLVAPLLLPIVGRGAPILATELPVPIRVVALEEARAGALEHLRASQDGVDPPIVMTNTGNAHATK